MASVTAATRGGAMVVGGTGGTVADRSGRPASRYTSAPSTVSFSSSRLTSESSSGRWSLSSSIARSSAWRSRRETSLSISAWVASANGRLDMGAPPPPRNTDPPSGYPIGPSLSDRPNSLTILVARSVAPARSLAAPVDPWPITTSSAARPPRRTASESSR